MPPRTGNCGGAGPASSPRNRACDWPPILTAHSSRHGAAALEPARLSVEEREQPKAAGARPLHLRREPARLLRGQAMPLQGQATALRMVAMRSQAIAMALRWALPTG